MSHYTEDLPSGGDAEGVTLQAVDIMHQKFRVRMRGYDTQDVEAYLDIVAREVDRLVSENTRLQERVITMRRKIDQYRASEQNMNAALLSVQEVSSEIKQRATQESERMLAEARDEAEQLREKATDDSSALLLQARKDAERIGAEARDAAVQVRTEVQTQVADEKAALAQLHNDTEQECQSMRAAAEVEASRITDELLKRRATLQQEIDDLAGQREQFRSSLRTVINTHLQSLEDDAQQD